MAEKNGVGVQGVAELLWATPRSISGTVYTN